MKDWRNWVMAALLVLFAMQLLAEVRPYTVVAWLNPAGRDIVLDAAPDNYGCPADRVPVYRPLTFGIKCRGH